MSMVLDGSVALAWCFVDEQTLPLEALLEQVVQNSAVVPAIWRLEVANGLRSAIRRGRLSGTDRDAILLDLMQLPITCDGETDRHAWAATQALSEHYGLTPYDASYLEVARRRNLPLATLDKAMHSAAKKAGIELIDL